MDWERFFASKSNNLSNDLLCQLHLLALNFSNIKFDFFFHLHNQKVFCSFETIDFHLSLIKDSTSTQLKASRIFWFPITKNSILWLLSALRQHKLVNLSLEIFPLTTFSLFKSCISMYHQSHSSKHKMCCRLAIKQTIYYLSNYLRKTVYRVITCFAVSF